jgi:hypothetical protein
MDSKNSKKSQDKELERALLVLEHASMRLTQTRVAILKALISDHGPFSVDEVRDLAGESDLDRVTVYRCLLLKKQDSCAGVSLEIIYLATNMPMKGTITTMSSVRSAARWRISKSVFLKP